MPPFVCVFFSLGIHRHYGTRQKILDCLNISFFGVLNSSGDGFSITPSAANLKTRYFGMYGSDLLNIIRERAEVAKEYNEDALKCLLERISLVALQQRQLEARPNLQFYASLPEIKLELKVKQENHGRVQQEMEFINHMEMLQNNILPPRPIETFASQRDPLLRLVISKISASMI